jgi:hypothetical protein
VVAVLRSMVARKTERRASRTTDSVAVGRERMEKRRGRSSWVRSGVEREEEGRVWRRRVRVWRRAVRREGVRKGLYAFLGLKVSKRALWSLYDL